MRYLIGLVCLLIPCGAFARQPPAPNTPKVTVPDRDTLAAINSKRVELLELIQEVNPPADVLVYAKAVEWIARHGEWYGANAGKQTLAVLDTGIARAKEWKEKPAIPSWLKVRGKPIIRGYISRVDGSVQPYALTIPEGYDPTRRDHRLDILLAGRDATKTEVKFIATRDAVKAGKTIDRIVVEPYGRGNNAYRWAGETDVFESYQATQADIDPRDEQAMPLFPYDPNRKVLRGFSMGGAGTWHLGLHHPMRFAAIAPGAGFTVTRGYVRTLPAMLPDYIEKCLHIYDAADYAENAAIVPVVAYSGEMDPQIAAARNIEDRIKDVPTIKPFRHFVAPGLEHKLPPEWLAKIDEELAAFLPRKPIQQIRFVTYTPKYGDAGWVRVFALTRQYQKAIVDARLRGSNPTITTTNVRLLGLTPTAKDTNRITIDGQQFDWPRPKNEFSNGAILHREGTVWKLVDEDSVRASVAELPIKRIDLQGPIDDAFMSSFFVVPPKGVPMHKVAAVYAGESLQRFGREWDKWMRGKLPSEGDEKTSHLVLFGDPGCNPRLAEILPKLPITWTDRELIVNGVKYDPHTHVPVLIYPNPNNPERYVVINSGHTFHEADFRGTNALLYPRLGDWAVLKPTPTRDDPTAAEVVAAGLFDENWKFRRP
jgi:hypothetical protein